MPAEAKNKQNPVPNSPQVIAEGKAHWADHCATCHANNGSGQTEMGKNMYPPSPDMRKQETQQMTNGELFYVIENGVRLSGMPAWGTGAHEDQESSWKLVRFIRHLPDLSQEEISEMEKLNPKSPDELQEEQ
jgi:mono/diheme cytochrome c family protein